MIEARSNERKTEELGRMDVKEDPSSNGDEKEIQGQLIEVQINRRANKK